MDVVWRILNARTHFDVLELEPAAAEPAVVRRKYKTLAMLVHPDKNRHQDAEAAFKLLSQAYECLVDAQTQRAYVAKLARGARPQHKPPPPPPGPQSSAVPRPSQSWPPKKPKKQYRKTPAPPPPPPRGQRAETAPSQRWRTPEEIWAQIQREEEEQARLEFLAKGFQRDFEKGNATTNRNRATRGDGENDKEPHDAAVDELDEQAVETHASEWAMWKRARVEKDREEPPLKPPPTIVCCLICRRKFPTEAALVRHELLSLLHKQNLQRYHESEASATSAEAS